MIRKGTRKTRCPCFLLFGDGLPKRIQKNFLCIRGCLTALWGYVIMETEVAFFEWRNEDDHRNHVGF